MLKSKCKLLLLLVVIITLISSLSFATIEPRTSSEDDIMPISEEPETDEIAENTENEDVNWVNNDLYIAKGNVVVDQIVNGNSFVFADEVIVTGEIGGDLFVCANKLTIDGGYIYNSLFAVANEITIKGIVYDVYAIANKFTLDSDGFVYRDLKVSANTLNLNGKVGRDVYVTASNYNFAKDNGSLIGGKLEYYSNSEISIPDGVVLGEVKFNRESIVEENVVEKVFDYIFDAINLLVYTFVVLLLAIWLAPKFVNRVTNMDTKKAFVSFGIGILAPMAAIIVLFMLLISTVASTLSVAGILVFIAICMSGTAFASIYFGSLFIKLVKWNGKVKFVLATLITALIIWAISQIPYIGGIFGFLVSLFGIGTLLVNTVYRKETQKEIQEEVQKEEN